MTKKIQLNYLEKQIPNIHNLTRDEIVQAKQEILKREFEKLKNKPSKIKTLKEMKESPTINYSKFLALKKNVKEYQEYKLNPTGNKKLAEGLFIKPNLLISVLASD